MNFQSISILDSPPGELGLHVSASVDVSLYFRKYKKYEYIYTLDVDTSHSFEIIDHENWSKDILMDLAPLDKNFYEKYRAFTDNSDLSYDKAAQKFVIEFCKGYDIQVLKYKNDIEGGISYIILDPSVISNSKLVSSPEDFKSDEEFKALYERKKISKTKRITESILSGQDIREALADENRLSQKDIENVVRKIKQTHEYGKYFDVYVDGPDWNEVDPEDPDDKPSVTITYCRDGSQPLPDIDEEYGEEFDNGGDPPSLEEFVDAVDIALSRIGLRYYIWDGTDGVGSKHIYVVK